MMDIFRLYVGLHHDSSKAASYAADSLIASAIAIGHAEGRHMTAGDISVTIGLPRSTVITRLKPLEASGAIEYRMAGRRKVIWISQSDDATLDEMEAIIHRVCRELTQLSAADTL